jgi:hypothetical protein
VKETYLAGRKVVLNNGDLVRFVKDSWTDDPPWCDYFPALFDFAKCKTARFVLLLKMTIISLSGVACMASF